jgi:hypothetical protein
MTLSTAGNALLIAETIMITSGQALSTTRISLPPTWKALSITGTVLFYADWKNNSVNYRTVHEKLSQTLAQLNLPTTGQLRYLMPTTGTALSITGIALSTSVTALSTTGIILPTIGTARQQQGRPQNSFANYRISSANFWNNFAALPTTKIALTTKGTALSTTETYVSAN